MLPRRMRARADDVVLRSGVALAALLVGTIAAATASSWRVGAALVQMVGLELVVGREAGIPVALQAGAPVWLVILVSFTQDMAVAALVYPLAVRFLFGGGHAGERLGRRVRALEAAAHRHRAWAQRWGPLGVFLFMLVPFLVNGPLVGGVLGRVAGIPTRRLVVPVAAATFLSILAWTLAYEALFAASARVDGRLPIVLTLLVVALAFSGLAWSAARDRRRPPA